MLYILFGQDDFSIDRSLDEIKRDIGDELMLAVNTTMLDGQRVSPDQLGNICGTVPFMAERRLVIVNGLLERFEGKAGVSKRWKKSAAAEQNNEWQSFGACFDELPDSLVLVLTDGKISEGNPLLKELHNKAEVRTFPLLKGARLQQWIKQHVSGAGGSISPQAIKLLTELVGSNLWIMDNEINKLVAFTAGRRIEEEDVKVVVNLVLQANIFTMVDAILEFRTGMAQQAFQQLLQQGSSPVYLLAMLSRQVRMVVRAKELKNQRTPEVKIQEKLRLTSEFVLRKTLEQADRYSLPRLKQIYHKLLDTDLSIKTGRLDDELALSILVAELCQRDS